MAWNYADISLSNEEIVLICRNNATINAHVKTQNLVKHRSDTLIRDPTRPGQNRWPGDPVTRWPVTRFHLWSVARVCTFMGPSHLPFWKTNIRPNWKLTNSYWKVTLSGQTSVNCGSLFFTSGNGPLCTGKALARGRTNRFSNIFLLWPWSWLLNLIYLESRCNSMPVICIKGHNVRKLSFGDTHTTDLLLYLDHKMVCKTSTYFTRPIL